MSPSCELHLWVVTSNGIPPQHLWFDSKSISFPPQHSYFVIFNTNKSVYLTTIHPKPLVKIGPKLDWLINACKYFQYTVYLGMEVPKIFKNFGFFGSKGRLWGTERLFQTRKQHHLVFRMKNYFFLFTPGTNVTTSQPYFWVSMKQSKGHFFGISTPKYIIYCLYASSR